MDTLENFQARAARGEAMVGDRVAGLMGMRGRVLRVTERGCHVRWRSGHAVFITHVELGPVGHPFTIVGERLGWGTTETRGVTYLSRSEAEGGAAFCCDPTNDSAHLRGKVQHHQAENVARLRDCKFVAIVRYLPGCSPRKAG